MEIRTFSRINRERCESPNGFDHKMSDWSTSDWFTALLGELGEAANVAKKLNRLRDGARGNTAGVTKEELLAQLASELADTYIYLDLLFQSLGIDPEAAVLATWHRKSEQIGYKESTHGAP